MRLAEVLAVLLLLPRAGAAAQTPSKTESTTYAYNADGALLRVSTQVTENNVVGDPTETYFTWDNCTPQAGSPPTCALQPANGNLLGYGPTPGSESEWSAHYDLLDRMTQVTNAQGQTAVYQYHPDELLKASLNAEAPTTDGLQHYYDQSHYAQVTNLYDRHTGTLSSRHAQIRYLEDGTQQLLVRHRKDTDGVYDPSAQTMTSYTYDPYGASGPEAADPGAMSGPLYSLSTNPYRYSHELRDPVSGADYLRARWYLPGHQTFVQRDPVRNLNRYGYAHGNPVMNLDPGGTSAKFFKPLVHGFADTFTSVFGVRPIVQDMHKEGWKFFSNARNDVNLAMTLVSTMAMIADVSETAYGVGTGFSRRLVKRTALSMSIGSIAFAETAALRGGGGPVRAAGEIIGGFLGGSVAQAGAMVAWTGIQGGTGMLVSRIAGYEHNLDDGALHTRLTEMQNGEVLLLHQKSYVRVLNAEARFVSDEYQPNHSALVRVEKVESGFSVETNELAKSGVVGHSFQPGDAYLVSAQLESIGDSPSKSYRVIKTGSDIGSIAKLNPMKFKLGEGSEPLDAVGTREYSLFRNNCHMHVEALLKTLGIR